MSTDFFVEKCPNCGKEMQEQEYPQSIFEIKIPFTQLEIQLWDWGKKEMICIDCAIEEQDDPYRKAYSQGCEDGYYEALSKHKN